MATTLTPRMKPKTERTVGRKRKELDPRSANIRERFALRLRELLEERNWQNKDLADRLQASGLEVSDSLVDKWLRAERVPQIDEYEQLAEILIGTTDYRMLLPSPVPKRRRK